MSSRYYTAEVCENGHVTTSSVEISPELRSKFCPECGGRTMQSCSKCNSPIRGFYHVEGFLSLAEYDPPNHCYNCGAAFPWKERALDAVSTLVDESELSTSEKQQLKDAVEGLTIDTPQTEVASARFKRLMKKVGAAVGPSIEKIVTTVATEAAKKTLGF